MKMSLREEKKAIEDIFDIIETEFERKKIKYDYIYLRIMKEFRTVGVQGDKRTYAHPLFIRVSNDRKFIYNPKLLTGISTKILNKVQHINRVLYDITDSKEKDQGLYFFIKKR